MIVHVQVDRPQRWHKVQTVTFVSPAPCRTPARIVAGARTVWIDCGRRLPRYRQCAGCRVRLVIESDQATLQLEYSTTATTTNGPEGGLA